MKTEDEFQKYVSRVLELARPLDALSQAHFADMEGADSDDFALSEHGYVAFARARDELRKHVAYVNRIRRKKRAALKAIGITRPKGGKP